MKLKTFGERLNWARRNHARITQKELCEKMEEQYGVSIGANYISELEGEKAKKRPSLEVVSAMARVLKVSIDWLAGHTENLTVGVAEENSPNYMTPEADEVAQIVDTLPAEQRIMILQGVIGIASPLSEQRRMRAGVRHMLDSVERTHGVEARREMENRLREIGMRWDNS